MEIPQWIKDSCIHQKATEPEDFIGMTMAWYFSLTFNGFINQACILTLFKLVNHNLGMEFRKTEVTFLSDDGAGTHYGLKPEFIERQLQLLIDAWNEEVVRGEDNITPEEFYQQFEEIHPCEDGNGRVGAILYNCMKASLFDPIHPPAFKRR